MASDSQDIADLKRQVQRQGELIDALYRHLGIGQLAAAGETEAVPQQIVDAIRSGNMIVAIKLWRERTGVGLAEAKQQVEDFAKTL